MQKLSAWKSHNAHAQESIERQRPSLVPAPDTDWEATNTLAVVNAPAGVPVSAASHKDRQVPSLSVVAGCLPRAGKTPSGANRKAAAVAFLQDVLAHGPVSVRDIERRAVEAGVLSKGTPLGKAKVFRIARKSLGIKPYQRSGKPAAGWLWALPNQATSEAQPAAPPTSSPVREARETQAAPKSKPISDVEWVIAIKLFRECGVWSDDLGPPPGRSGCRVPVDVLESYGYAGATKRSA
jgi:hypothetical protein